MCIRLKFEPMAAVSSCLIKLFFSCIYNFSMSWLWCLVLEKITLISFLYLFLVKKSEGILLVCYLRFFLLKINCKSVCFLNAELCPVKMNWCVFYRCKPSGLSGLSTCAYSLAVSCVYPRNLLRSVSRSHTNASDLLWILCK